MEKVFLVQFLCYIFHLAISYFVSVMCDGNSKVKSNFFPLSQKDCSLKGGVKFCISLTRKQFETW